MSTNRWKNTLAALAAVAVLTLPAGAVFARPLADDLSTAKTSANARLTAREAYFNMKEAQVERADASGAASLGHARAARSLKARAAAETYMQFKERQMLTIFGD